MHYKAQVVDFLIVILLYDTLVDNALHCESRINDALRSSDICGRVNK